MGTEIEIVFNYQVDNIKFSLNPAVYLPSTYYPTLAATNTFIPNGTDPFFGMGFNLTYVLDPRIHRGRKTKGRRRSDRQDRRPARSGQSRREVLRSTKCMTKCPGFVDKGVLWLT